MELQSIFRNTNRLIVSQKDQQRKQLDLNGGFAFGGKWALTAVGLLAGG